MGRPAVNPLAFAARHGGVPSSPEVDRITALPTRDPDGSSLVALMSERLKTKGGQQDLSPDQALALHDLYTTPGAVCLMRPGSGKTHVGALAFTVTESHLPMYLCPSSARDTLLADEENGLPAIARHWKVHPFLHQRVFGFGELSSKRGRNLLENVHPDVIVVDEFHKLNNRDCARGNRIVEYVWKYPQTRLLLLSGSPFERALESAHLFGLALRAGTPLPLANGDIDLWNQAIGPDIEDWERPGAGALQAFVDLLPPERRLAAKDSVQLLRWAVRERMRITPGVVVSTQNPTKTQVTVRSPRVTVPEGIRDAFALLAKWKIGEEDLTDLFEIATAARELICGFYYKWVWPNGKENTTWVEKRKEWHRFVRHVVIDRPSRRTLHREHSLGNKWPSKSPHWDLPVGLDSKGYVEDACRAHEAYMIAKERGLPLAEKLEGVLRLDCQQYRDWMAVQHEYKIVTEPVWIDEYLIDYAEEWLSKNNGIVWVPHKAVAAKLIERGVRYFGGGEQAAVDIVRYRGPCAASFKSHHESKNLQHWSKGLYLLPPSTGQAWEQSIARFDRRGQKSETIDLEVLLLCRQTFSGFQKALARAHYVNDSFDTQRLCQADLSGVLTDADIEEVSQGRGDPLWST